MDASSTAMTMILTILGFGVLAVVSLAVYVAKGVWDLVQWSRDMVPYFHQEEEPDRYSRQGGEMKTGRVIGIARPPGDLTLVRVVVEGSTPETFVFRVAEVHRKTHQPVRIDLEDQLIWGHDLYDSSRLDWASSRCPQAQPLSLMSSAKPDLPLLQPASIREQGI